MATYILSSFIAGHAEKTASVSITPSWLDVKMWPTDFIVTKELLKKAKSIVYFMMNKFILSNLKLQQEKIK